MSSNAGRIIGIGGVFFQSPAPESLRAWYGDKLGFPPGPGGAVLFPWRSAEAPNQEHVTVWSVFPSASDYFQPSDSTFMVNYIVDDLDAFLQRMEEAEVRVDPKRETYDYGRFAWIYDPDGNKIELWEPASGEKADAE